MNPKQRLVLIIAVLAVIIAGLIPPWKYYVGEHYVGDPSVFASGGYRPLWHPPDSEQDGRYYSVDYERLLIGWVVIVVVGGIVCLILKSRTRPRGTSTI